MTRFECAECGQLGRFVHHETAGFYADCPVCERTTQWEFAFEGEGVSF
ncbi:hypothetical protein [Halegenticoccus soli]|nr:hypothetical protein [Halegenticoccus soli]